MFLTNFLEVVPIDGHGHGSGEEGRSFFQCPEQQIPVFLSFLTHDAQLVDGAEERHHLGPIKGDANAGRLVLLQEGFHALVIMMG